MELGEETVQDLTRRLHRIAGQIRGIEQMLVDQRDCREVVTQVSAAAKALDQVGFLIVASGLEQCLSDPEAMAAKGYELDDVQRMFLKLA
jgi:DNA-binding FrmR family transcriptional regulator